MIFRSQASPIAAGTSAHSPRRKSSPLPQGGSWLETLRFRGDYAGSLRRMRMMHGVMAETRAAQPFEGARCRAGAQADHDERVPSHASWLDGNADLRALRSGSLSRWQARRHHFIPVREPGWLPDAQVGRDNDYFASPGGVGQRASSSSSTAAKGSSRTRSVPPRVTTRRYPSPSSR